MHESTNGDQAVAGEPVPRREFFSTAAMGCGLVAGYGTLAAMGGAYLYPAHSAKKIWVFVTELDGMALGASLTFKDPTGAKIIIARHQEEGGADDFIALSSTCPHLGCQVHWQPQENDFYCPCHNGRFNPQGKAVSGPPAAAGQSLAHYPLKVTDGLLFIEVPVERLRGPEEV